MAATLKSEQMVLLPGGNLSGPGYQTGEHTIILSGFADAVLMDTDDDETMETRRFEFTLGPVWSLQRPVQASAMVSLAEIASLDADEVDRSHWGVADVQTRAVTESGGQRVRVSFEVSVKGEYNRVYTVAVHLVANGLLLNLPARSELNFI